MNERRRKPKKDGINMFLGRCKGNIIVVITVRLVKRTVRCVM
jgi:hypothetical protein